MSPAKTLTVRNVKIKVKDLGKFDPQTLQPYSRQKQSQNEVAVMGDKPLIVPSMGAISKIFIEHEMILKRLKDQVELLSMAC